MEKVKQIVNAKTVYTEGLTGQGIGIALLDTGVFLHEDIQNNIMYFKDYVMGRMTSYDDNGHGTHVAGILSGKNGMAPGARIYNFKVLDRQGDGKTEDAIKAMNWILENHKKYRIRILNFSVGYMPDTKQKMQMELMEKLEQLWDAGVVVVTAAGNNGPKENTVTVPGVSRKVITVGDNTEDYGGRGPTTCCVVKPEILAPGTMVTSLGTKSGQYIVKSGTSMSAPVVSGALALALEKDVHLSPAELKLLLYDSVDRIMGKTFVWGLLNVDNLIKML